MSKSLPKTVFVTLQNEGDSNEYLDVVEDITAILIDEGCKIKVGVYQLVEIKTAIKETKFIK